MSENTTISAEDFSAFTASRRTVRSFLPDPVPAEVLDAVLADATTAPSWSNTRPYMVAIAQGDRADRLRDAYVRAFDKAQPAMSKGVSGVAKVALTGGLPDGDFKFPLKYPAPLRERQVKVGAGLYGHLGIAREDRQARDELIRANCRAFGAPVIGFVFVHSGLMPFAAMDAGIMLQTLFLSAHAHGLSTCALGTLAIWRHPVDAEFAVPDEYKLVTGFAMGYRSGAPINDFAAERPALALVDPKNVAEMPAGDA